MARPQVSTVGELRQLVERGDIPRRTVHEEVRENLIRKLRTGEALFPGIIGYDDTVIPQLVNALLSRHNFILLGLRGQAKTRLLRALVTLLDHEIPVMAGCEINDDPLAPLCSACRQRIEEEGDATPTKAPVPMPCTYRALPLWLVRRMVDDGVRRGLDEILSPGRLPSWFQTKLDQLRS